MNILQSPFILLKRGKDDYSGGGGPYDGNAAVKFAHEIFDPIDSQLVDTQLAADPSRALDISEKLLRYAHSIDTNGSIDGSDAGVLRDYISHNTDWLEQLDAWAAANPPGGVTPPPVTTPTPTSVAVDPSTINTTGSQLYNSAIDLDAELTGNVGSSAVNGALSGQSQTTTESLDALSTVGNAATAGAVAGVGNAANSTADQQTNGAGLGLSAVTGANQALNQNASTNNQQNPYDELVSDIVADYGLTPTEERYLENFFSKNPDLTREAVDQFISTNSTTWRNDLATFDVALSFNLTPEQTNNLIHIMHGHTGWTATDARNYLATLNPSQYESVLSQAADAIDLATTNNMTQTQAQNLTAAMVSNNNLVSEDIQAFIDQNPEGWSRVLAINDYASTVPNITEAQKNTLVYLAKESSVWTLDHLKEVVAEHPTTWQTVVAQEEFFIKNHMTAGQITLAKEFISLNPTTTLSEMQTYMDAHSTTWERDLTRSHDAREIAADHQFNAEQTKQLELYMVKFPTLTEQALETQIISDPITFKRALIVFVVAEEFHFTAEQKQSLDLILRTNAHWGASDVKAYLAAHPTDWMRDLTQFGNASVLTLNHNLTDQQESVLQSYLLSNPQVDAAALNDLIGDDPAAFEEILANVTDANEIAIARNFTEDQREQLVRVMSDGPKFSEAGIEQFLAEHGSDWAVALRQVDAAYIVARALELNDADREIVQKLMMTQHAATANGVAYFIQQNPTNWRTELQRMELSVRRGLTEYEDGQLKIFMQNNPTTSILEIDAYINANPNSWKNDLKLNLASTAADGIAAQHTLSAEDKQALTVWMAANPRLSAQQVNDLITQQPQTWQQNLQTVKTADAFAKSHSFTDQERESLIRVMLGDSGVTTDAMAALMSQSPDQWRHQLERIDGALAIGEALHLSADDQALVKRGMLMFSDLDFNTMAGFISGNQSDWKTKLQGFIDQAIDGMNPIGDHVDGGIQVTTGNSLTPARIEWTYAVSFEDFKANFDFSDQSKWVEQDVKVSDAQVSYSGKNETLIPAVYERRLAPPTPEILEQLYIQQYGSPVDKARGHLLGSYSFTEIIYTGKDQSTVGPTTVRYADFGTIDPGQTTGDGRNKDMVWTGNFDERMSNFTGEINGVNYKDVDPSMVKYLDGPAYLARQLSDFAKASGFSYDNPSGDNAIQLGVYLDMVGLKDINNLYVKDGRYIDISTGKDLGSYKEGDPFCFSAYGKGWNDFMPNVMPNGQVVLVPKWGSTSDLGTIVMVVAIVAAVFTAGASIAAVGAAAGTAGASIATTVGAGMLGSVGITAGTLGLSATAFAGVSAGLGIATLTTGVKLLAGESMSFGDVAKSMVIGAASGWAGGEFLNLAGGATAGGTLTAGGFASTMYSAGMQSVGSTLFSNAVQGNSLTAGLGQNLTTSLVGAGIGYGVNSLNTNFFEGALNSQQVGVVSNVLTTAALGGSALDIGASIFRGLTNVSSDTSVTAISPEQRAFLEANGLVTVDVLNANGVVTGSYTTTLPDGTQRLYFNDDDGNPSHIDKYYEFDRTTGNRVLVTETYGSDGIQTHRTTTPVTGIDLTNPTANVLSVVTANDPKVGGSTISYGVNGSAGVVVKDANGIMTGEVRVNDTTVVTYSAGPNGEQLERTSTLNPGGDSVRDVTQNLSNGTLSSTILVNGEPRTIQITNTTDRFTSVPAGDNRAQITYSDGSQVVIDTQTGKAISGTIHTLAGDTTFNGNEVTTQLLTGGTVVENSVTNTRVTTIGNTVTTQSPQGVRIERTEDNGNRVVVTQNAGSTQQSVQVFADDAASAAQTAKAAGLPAATLVLANNSMVDYIAPSAGQGTQLQNSTAGASYIWSVDSNGDTVKDFGAKGFLTETAKDLWEGEVLVNDSTIARYTVVNGVQRVEQISVDAQTGNRTTLTYNAETGTVDANIVRSNGGGTSTNLSLTNTERYTESQNESGQLVRTFSNNEAVVYDANNRPIGGGITTLQGFVQYAPDKVTLTTHDGMLSVSDLGPDGQVIRVTTTMGNTTRVEQDGKVIGVEVREGSMTVKFNIDPTTQQRTVVVSGGTYNEAHAYMMAHRELLDSNGNYSWTNGSGTTQTFAAQNGYSTDQWRAAQEFLGRTNISAADVGGALLSIRNLSAPRDYSADAGAGRGNYNPGDFNAEVAQGLGISNPNNVTNANRITYLVANGYTGSLTQFSTGNTTADLRAADAGFQLRIDREYQTYVSGINTRNTDLTANAAVDRNGQPMVRLIPVQSQADWEKTMYGNISREQGITDRTNQIMTEMRTTWTVKRDEWESRRAGDAVGSMRGEFTDFETWVRGEAGRRGFISAIPGASSDTTLDQLAWDRITNGQYSASRDGTQFAAMAALAPFSLVTSAALGAGYVYSTSLNTETTLRAGEAGQSFATDVLLGAALPPVLRAGFNGVQALSRLADDVIQVVSLNTRDISASINHYLSSSEIGLSQRAISTVDNTFSISNTQTMVLRNADGGFVLGSPTSYTGVIPNDHFAVKLPDGSTQVLPDSVLVDNLGTFNSHNNLSGMHLGQEIDLGQGRLGTVVSMNGDNVGLRLSDSGLVLDIRASTINANNTATFDLNQRSFTFADGSSVQLPADAQLHFAQTNGTATNLTAQFDPSSRTFLFNDGTSFRLPEGTLINPAGHGALPNGSGTTPNVVDDVVGTGPGGNSGPNVGMGYQRIEHEMINGQDGFIKVTYLKEDGSLGTGANRSASDVQNEIAMARELGDAGISPQFLGTRISDDGFVSIITRNEPGVHLDSRLIINPSQVTQAHLDSILDLANRVDQIGLNGRDVQFRLTTDGRAVLVDLEGISHAGDGIRGDLGNTLRDMANQLVVDKIAAKFETGAFKEAGFTRLDATDLLGDSQLLSRTEKFQFLQKVNDLNFDDSMEFFNGLVRANNDGGAPAARQYVKDWNTGHGEIVDNVSTSQVSTQNLFDSLSESTNYSSNVRLSIEITDGSRRVMSGGFNVASDTIADARMAISEGGAAAADARTYLGHVRDQMNEISHAADELGSHTQFTKNNIESDGFVTTVYDSANGNVKISVIDQSSNRLRVDIDIVDGSRTTTLKVYVDGTMNRSIDDILNEIRPSIVADATHARTVAGDIDSLLARNDFDSLHVESSTGSTGNTGAVVDDPYVNNYTRDPDPMIGNFDSPSMSGIKYETVERGFTRDSTSYESVFRNADGVEIGRLEYKIEGNLIDVDLTLVPEAFRRQGININMFQDVLAQHPNVNGIRAGNLIDVNLEKYTEAFDAARAEGKSLAESMRLGIENTPRYHSNMNIGFTELEFNPANSGTPEFIMRRPNAAASDVVNHAGDVNQNAALSTGLSPRLMDEIDASIRSNQQVSNILRTPEQTTARVTRDLNNAQSWAELETHRTTVMAEVESKYRIERVDINHPQLAGKSNGVAVGQDVIYVNAALSTSQEFSVILHELNHLQLSPTSANLRILSSIDGLGTGRSYEAGFRTDEIKSSAIDFATNAQTISAAIGRSDLAQVVDESMLSMQNSIARRAAFINDIERSGGDVLSSGVSVDGFYNLGRQTITSTRNGISTDTVVNKWMYEIKNSGIGDNPTYFEFTTQPGLTAAQAAEKFKDFIQGEMNSLNLYKTRLADDIAYFKELNGRVESSRFNQGVNVAEAELSDADIARLFGGDSPSMNLVTPSTGLPDSVFRAPDLNVYRQPVENSMSHSSFVNDVYNSGGALRASGEAINDAVQAFSSHDPTLALRELAGANRELNNLVESLEGTAHLEGRNLQLLSQNQFGSRYEFAIANSNSHFIISESPNGLRVQAEINGPSGTKHRLEFEMNDPVTHPTSFDFNASEALLNANRNLRLEAALSEFSSRNNQMLTNARNMLNDTESLARMIRMDQQIANLSPDQAAHNLASNINRNVASVDNNVVNIDFNQPGQFGFDSSGMPVVRVHDGVAVVENFGDGLVAVNANHLWSGVADHEMGHAARVAEAAQAGGLSPATSAMRMADGSIKNFDEVLAYPATIRAQFSSYQDVMRLADEARTAAREFEIHGDLDGASQARILMSEHLQVASQIYGELPSHLRRIEGELADNLPARQAALRAESQGMIENTLARNDADAPFNQGFVRYTYQAVGADGRIYDLFAEVPAGVTDPRRIVSLIHSQNETALVTLNRVANELNDRVAADGTVTLGLRSMVADVVHHADYRGLTPSQFRYAGSESSTGPVMNMDLQHGSLTGAASEGQSLMAMLLGRESSISRNVASDVANATPDNVISITPPKTALELLDEGRAEYLALSANRETKPVDRLLARQRVNQLERDAIPEMVALDDGSDLLRLLQKDFKATAGDQEVAHAASTLSVEEMRRVSQQATDMVNRGQVSDMEILFTQTRAARSAKDIVDDLCRQALGPSAAEQNRIFAIKAQLDGKNAFQITIDPTLKALDRELFAIERRYRPFNQDELLIFEAVSEIPSDTIRLSKSELKWFEDARNLVYGPEGKTHLFPADVEALAKVNGFIDQIAANRNAVIAQAHEEIRHLNNSRVSYVSELPRGTEADFKRAFGLSQRTYNTGDANHQVDVWDAFKTVLTKDPESAIHGRDDMYRWAHQFFVSSIATPSGALRNTLQDNPAMKYIYDRMVQIEKMFEMMNLNTFTNPIPGKI